MTDDPQERFPNPPSRGASQVVESAIAGATGIVPVAGPSLVEITHLVMGAPYQKRMHAWFEEVAQGISDLQARDQAPDWEALVSDEQFLDVLLHASRAIQGTGREEKRLALRNAVMNTASGRSPGEDLERRFVSIVDSCVPEHLRLLLYLDDPVRGLRIRGIRKDAVADRMESGFKKEHGATADPPLPWWTGYMRDALLDELISTFDEDRQASLRLFGDLEDWRLTGSVEPGVWSGFVSALGRESARAARHFGFAQPMFRTSIKLRFTGEGVSGHDLRSDTAGLVIGGMSEVVDAAAQDAKVPKDATKLFLSPTVLPGSTILELFGPPAKTSAQEKLDTEIDDGPTDIALGRVFGLLDVMNLRSIGNAAGADLAVSTGLGNKLFALSNSLIETQVDLDLVWTRPRGTSRAAVFSRDTARGFRALLDVETVNTVPRNEIGILTNISTDGSVGFAYGEKRNRSVTLDAADVEAELLRSLWATEVVLSWIEVTKSHPRRGVASQIERTVTDVRPRTAPLGDGEPYHTA